MTMITVINQEANTNIVSEIKQELTSTNTEIVHSTSSIMINNTIPHEIGVVIFGVGSGKSAYEIAREGGFEGTEADFIISLKGNSAYDVALNTGFVGTREEWLDSLKGNSAYDVALNTGFVGTEEEWIESLRMVLNVTPAVSGHLLSNDGATTLWVSLQDKLNSDSIEFDLGEL